MQRKVTLLMVLVILLGLLAGCQQETVDERKLSVFELTLSDEMKDKLNASFLAWYEQEYNVQAGPKDVWLEDTPGVYRYTGCRYYGTFEDCIVWFSGGDLGFPNEQKIAGSVFSHPVYAQYHAYKNGAYATLEKAYAQGWISAEDIAIVAERHAAYNEKAS